MDCVKALVVNQGDGGREVDIDETEKAMSLYLWSDNYYCDSSVLLHHVIVAS